MLYSLEKNQYTLMIPTRRSVLSERETPSGLPYVGLYSRSLLLESVKSFWKAVQLLLSWKINPGKGSQQYFMYNPCGQGAQCVKETLGSNIILSLAKAAWLSHTDIVMYEFINDTLMSKLNSILSKLRSVHLFATVSLSHCVNH